MATILPHEHNPALRQKARDIPPAEIRGEQIQRLIAEMKALLAKEEYGVALAAPQVGEPLRLFIVSGRALAQYDETDGSGGAAHTESASARPVPADQVYINPVLLKLSRGKTDKHEGCLSIRGYWGEVPRAEKASIRALDEHGVPFTRGASGFLAHVFQHEMDHLDGILYIDKATRMYEEQADHEE